VPNDGQPALLLSPPASPAGGPERRRAGWRLPLAGFVALVVALLSPALYNGSPLLFPDSAGYFRSGEATLDAVHWLVHARLAPPAGAAGVAAPPSPDRDNDGVSTARSVFYGVPVVMLYRFGGVWLVALAQVVLTAVVLRAGLRQLGGVASPWRDHVAILVAALLGGLAVFAVTIMPDVFAGLLILATAIFVAFRHRLAAGERAAWLALIVFGVLVHKGHLALLASIIVVAGVAAVMTRRFEPRAFAGLGLALAIGWSGHGSVDFAVARMTGAPPIPTQFLLARVVGDGTALPYLDAVCGTEDLLLCRYRDRFPMSEDEFLWSTRPGVGVVGHLGEADQRRLAAQSGGIVIGAIRRDPWRQAKATLGNMARQTLTIGVASYGMRTGLEPGKAPGFAAALGAYRQTRVFAGRLPLVAMSGVMTAAFVVAALAIAGVVAARPATLFSGDERARALQIILAGVLLNACIFGAVSSVSDRYQGRVAWLVPLVAVTLLWRPRQARHSREAPSAARKISSVETR
jgi:hypothetical protein